ncbi:hypothetical protein GIW81_08505 [Hyphomicrobium sp. xq]|uniref:N-acetyltransferase domain-containing protein n=1 Tax=Hyphomicrobium album TaxID=2665159 RepID=A0A6I3KJ69_9HYPH|nr:GNAT family N-acetyltransferase [Hyphomicrobium album]MTD94373.1 hypothetical protein [Hyphomicrobium album]
MAIAIKALSAGDDRSLAEVIRIYQGAIESSEQKPPEALEAMVGDPRYMVLAALDGARAVGFSISFFPSTKRFWLLEYMAADTAVRSQGLGALLFQETIRRGSERLPHAVCLLEVDRAPAAGSTDDEKWRRLQFYRRQGCLALEPLDYILPLEFAGSPPPMKILVCGADADARFDREWVKNVLASLYTEVYDVPTSDPRFASMTANLPESLELSVLPNTLSNTSEPPTPASPA